MKRVKVSYNGLAWPLERQTPGTSGIWGDCAFHINEDVNECDYWIVYEGLAGKEESICPADGMVFITGEPPAVRRYDPFFLDQFSKVVTCQRRIGHPGAIFSQQALPWFVGVRYDLTKKGRKDDWSVTMDYDALSRSEVKKDRTLSMMTSGKRSTSGHRKRLDFAHRLEK